MKEILAGSYLNFRVKVLIGIRKGKDLFSFTSKVKVFILGLFAGFPYSL